MTPERGSLLASGYYGAVGAASWVLRGRFGSRVLVGILSLIRRLQSGLAGSGDSHLIRGHLERAFPGREEAWYRDVISGFWWRHQAMMVALFATRRMGPDDLDEYLELHGRNHLDAALSSGRGVMLLVPHFGDERTLHILLAMAGYPVSVISSRYPEARPLVRRARLKASLRWNRVGFPDQSPRWLFETLRKGGILHIAPTGYGGPRGTWVKSFGVPVLASSSPYRLWKRSGCRMLIAYNRILPDMTYSMELQPFAPNPDGSDFTPRLFGRFEERAREFPAQYDWMHLVIRHRETNTIARTGRIPPDERELERLAVPEDSDPFLVADPKSLKGLRRR
jgi:KDO2-lipid IV(A) lauroyltransferase